MVYVPGLDQKKPLKGLTDWEVLNLNVDDICKLTDDVKTTLGDNAQYLDPVLEV